MKKIIFLFIVLIGISTSCTKNFDEYNEDTKNPTDVPGNMLFANAQKALADQVASTNVNLNVWKLFVQYWTETTYTDEANYDIINRTIADLTFRTYYRDVLADLVDAREKIMAEVPQTDEETIAQQNRLQITELIWAYCFNRLVDTFGDVPYTEALDIDDISPAYTPAPDIYQDIINRTIAAVDALDENGGSFGEFDLYFNGDVAMWKKFGNSLLVKMGITLSLVNEDLAKSTVLAGYNGDGGLFEFGERCELHYPGGAMSNPLYLDLVASGRDDFVPANTIVDLMNELEDPRREAYFTLYNDSIYLGGIYGESNAYANYSHIADRIKEQTFPMPLLTYTEVEFYLAEAAERGYDVGDAATHYANAITASFDFWQVDGADAYIEANPYNGIESIGIQAYIAFYIRGLVAYTEWRRLDVPEMNLPPSPAESADGAVPRRFTYPVNEQTLNRESRQAAVDRQWPADGDRLSSRIFWDVEN
ncbi:MAG: SusD/RagB family nutrient-binding outer membrane lipoprotein [Bacteroidales bacterium]